MIFRVFGKTNNKRSRWFCEETVKKIQDKTQGKKRDDKVEFCDMDTPLGKEFSSRENIMYVPSIMCEDEEVGELGFLENKFAIGGDTAIVDMNRSQEFWRELDSFLDDMFDLEKEKKNVV